MHASPTARELAKRYCTRDDLETFDPYDIWKTTLGFHVKDFYNHHSRVGLLPAAALTVFDNFVNNGARLFYKRQEYPIVRAWAAQILLDEYNATSEGWTLEYAEKHLQWLVENSCEGFSGPCWGLAFRYAVSNDLVYTTNTPLSTMTPYAIEAFASYSNITGNSKFKHVLARIFDFIESDIVVLEESDEYMVTSYAPLRDRRVINAVSYTMLSYALLAPYVGATKAERGIACIRKLYTYVRDNQQADGSWLYSPDGNSFIDCFHSCIILKNLLKVSKLFELAGSAGVIDKGYRYLKRNFFVPEVALMRRFSLANKPSIVKYDLYDNAEMLALACMMNDLTTANSLSRSILRVFVSANHIYSQIDMLGLKRGRDTLRWAVMPFIYAYLQYSRLLASGKQPPEFR